MKDCLYDLVQDYQTKGDPHLIKIFFEIEKVLAQKLDRLEFSQIIQTKANVEDLIQLKGVNPL
jgi:hypothetical protein